MAETSYRGNRLLKPRNTKLEWSKEQIREYNKCYNDPIYFAEKYMKIVNVDRGLVNFKLYDYQKEMLRSMHKNRFTIVATCRQAGKSTVTCAYILWYILFNDDKTVALLANKEKTALEICSRVALAYQHLPKWLQEGVVEFNKGTLLLENNSRVIATSTSSDSIRGYSINLLFIDECAHIEGWDDFYTSTLPTISSGDTTQMVLVSTPLGLNHFYKLWTEAQEGKNQFYPIEVKWNKVPGRDEAWKQTTLAAMSFDTEKFAQEHEVEWLGSSGTLIAGWKLKELVAKQPIFDRDGLKKFYDPVAGHTYAVVVDVSEGKALDYSALQVIDCSKMPYQQVCTYRSNIITPLDFAAVLNRVARAYNDAIVLVELKNLGGQVSDSLWFDYEYENFIYTEHGGRGGQKALGGASGTKKAHRGVTTSAPVKQSGCSILKLLIEQNQLIINDYFTIKELSTFSRKGKSYEAEPGNNDDLVMCLVLFGWLSDQQYFKEITDINTLSQLKEKTEEDLMNDLLPFGFIQDHSTPKEIPVVADMDAWLKDDDAEGFDYFPRNGSWSY